jgi:hypothetical protein
MCVTMIVTVTKALIGQGSRMEESVNDFRAGLSGTPLFTTPKFRRYPTTYSTTQNVNCIVIPLIE